MAAPKKKTAKKTSPAPKKKSAARPAPKSPKPPAAAPALSAMWEQEIDRLKRAAPKTVEEAVKLVVAGTLDRLKVPKSERGAMGQFLEDVLAHDPLIRGQISEALGLGLAASGTKPNRKRKP